jgi:DNA-binding winged helix-turn-helix (wHTH) protein
VVDLAAASGKRAVSFGPFRLLPAQRLLLEGDKAIRLGSRALDILIALVERAGELVGKDELVARVWPNTFVDESNLKFQIARCAGRWAAVTGTWSMSRDAAIPL